jgi:hypothetical protein
LSDGQQLARLQLLKHCSDELTEPRLLLMLLLEVNGLVEDLKLSLHILNVFIFPLYRKE